MFRGLPTFALVLLLLASGCSATRIVDTWKAPAFTGPPMRKMLVCAVHPEEPTRRIFEDVFVQKLSEQGIQGITCYSQLNGNNRPNEQELHEMVDKSGADGVMLVRLARISERTTYTPTYVVGAGAPFFYAGPFYPAYYTSIGFAYSPGYLETDTIVQLLTQVYQTKDGSALVWSGTSQTTDPESAKGLIKSAAPKFIGEMTKEGILPKPSKK